MVGTNLAAVLCLSVASALLPAPPGARVATPRARVALRARVATVAPDPTLGLFVTASSALVVAQHASQVPAYWSTAFLVEGLPLLVFGAFLVLQTFRTRFVYDDAAFEVTKRNLDGRALETDNFAVGGRSRWRYGDIVGYRFLPHRRAPALLYFTETKTTKSPPQMHLCPVLGDASQIAAEFAARGVEEL